MENLDLSKLQRTLRGKRIVKVAASEWSGIVHSLMNSNESGYISLTLDEGTTVEVGRLFIHEGNGQFESEQSAASSETKRKR